MTWVYDEILSWLLSLVGGLLNVLAAGFLECFDIGQDMFLSYMPFWKDLIGLIQKMGIAFCTVILIGKLLQNFLAPVTGQLEDPIILAGRYIVAMAMCFFTPQVIMYEFKFFQQIYSAVATIKFAGVDKSGEDLTLTDLGGLNLAAGLPGVGVGATAGVLIQLILTITIVWNFVKLLLEAAERYIVINLGVVFSPLAGSAFTSKETEKIFFTYIRVVFSQLLLMVMNIIFVRGTITMLSTSASLGLVQPGQFTQSDGTTAGNLMVFLLFVVAFEKAGMQVDAYMRSLGLDVVQTGQGLMGDLMVGVGAVSSMFKAGMNSMTGNGPIGRLQRAAANGTGIVGALRGARTQQARVNSGVGFAKAGTEQHNGMVGDMLRKDLGAKGMANNISTATAKNLQGAWQANGDNFAKAMGKAGFLDNTKAMKTAINAATGGALGSMIEGGIGNISEMKHLGNGAFAFKTVSGATGIISNNAKTEKGMVSVGNGAFMKNTGNVPLGVVHGVYSAIPRAGFEPVSMNGGLDTMYKPISTPLESAANGGIYGRNVASLTGEGGKIAIATIDGKDYDMGRLIKGAEGFGDSGLPTTATATLVSSDDASSGYALHVCGQNFPISEEAFNASRLDAITSSATEGFGGDGKYMSLPGQDSAFNREALRGYAENCLSEAAVADGYNGALPSIDDCAITETDSGIHVAAMLQATPDELRSQVAKALYGPNYQSQFDNEEPILNYDSGTESFYFSSLDGSNAIQIDAKDMAALEDQGYHMVYDESTYTASITGEHDGHEIGFDIGNDKLSDYDISKDYDDFAYVGNVGEGVMSEKTIGAFEDAAGVNKVTPEGLHIDVASADYSNLEENGYADIETNDMRTTRLYDCNKYEITGADVDTITIDDHTYAVVDVKDKEMNGAPSEIKTREPVNKKLHINRLDKIDKTDKKDNQ